MVVSKPLIQHTFFLSPSLPPVIHITLFEGDVWGKACDVSGLTYLYLIYWNHAHSPLPTPFLCEHSDHNVLCVLDKKEDEKKKSDEEQVMETAVAMDNWQKIGAPVVVAVESS